MQRRKSVASSNQSSVAKHESVDLLASKGANGFAPIASGPGGGAAGDGRRTSSRPRSTTENGKGNNSQNQSQLGMLKAVSALDNRMSNLETIAEKTLRRFNKLDDQMATLLQASSLSF